jgi:hypothetical protein
MELCQQLKQTSTVEHYIEQFEQWMLDMKRDHSYLPEGFFLLRFITGLKDTIKHDTQCHKPATLRAAYWFARKQELSYMSNKKSLGGPSTRSYTGITPARNTLPRDTRPRPPADRPRERGKCWYCPENWSYGHKCNEVKNLLHAIQLQGHSDEEDEDLGEQQNAPLNLPEEPPLQDKEQKEKLMSISLSAMEGTQGEETISLCVVIGGMNAIALVDSGSSNTFMDYDFAVKLNLPMRNTTARTVTVAGGGTLVTNAVVQQCTFSIQKIKFESTFRVLPLKGYDIVLGASWLKQYTPTTFDWASRSLTLHKNEVAHTFLDHLQQHNCHDISPKRCSKTLHKGQTVYLIQLYSANDKPVPLMEQQQHTHPEVLPILEEFQDLF